MEPSSEANLRNEVAEASRADAKAVPLLRVYREKLEKEAGALATETQTYRLRLIVICAAAGVVGVYALWTTLTSTSSIAAWVVTAGLAICAALYAQHRAKTQRQRATHLKLLHDKMLSAGRRIDGAERRLRG